MSIFLNYKAWNLKNHYMIERFTNAPDLSATEVYRNPDILYSRLGYDPNVWKILLDAWKKDIFGVDIFTGDLIRDLVSGKEYEVKIKDGLFMAISGKTEVRLDNLDCVRVMGLVIEQGRPARITA